MARTKNAIDVVILKLSFGCFECLHLALFAFNFVLNCELNEKKQQKKTPFSLHFQFTENIKGIICF